MHTGSGPLTDTAARLLRAIADELGTRILPELKSADAIERATLARLILQHLAGDLDVLPRMAEPVVAGLRGAISDALSATPPQAAEGVANWRQQLEAIASESGTAKQREVLALRKLAGQIVRSLADLGQPTAAARAGTEAVLRSFGAIDFRWLTEYATVRDQPPQPSAASAPANPTGPAAAATRASPGGAAQDRPSPTPPAPEPEPTVESVTRYLRERFPAEPQIAARAVVPIPGGRSKKTFFITIGGSTTLPADVVMRQDYALRYEGTKVRDEYTPLLKLAELRLPVPRPLLLQSEQSELGPPFILVERLSGSAPGTYFGLQKPCPGAFRDLAKVLARLHRVTPADVGFTVGPDPEKSVERILDQYQRKWRDNAVQPSPLIDYAYSWARSENARDPGAAAVVHGDCGPYNFLVENDRLTGLLDWEFCRVGDPAEDLGIARTYAESVLPWPEFLEIYHREGGSPVPERRVQLGMLLQFLKGTTLVAASGRNFMEGWTQEFIKGATAFTGLPLIELRIASLLQRFQAV